MTKDFDYVGITIARSVEGDAIVDVLCDQEGVEVYENQSYNEVRARGRLRLDFDELTAECGFPVDGSLIQVVMSTYYGRIAMTDDAVILTHDVVEAAGQLEAPLGEPAAQRRARQRRTVAEQQRVAGPR